MRLKDVDDEHPDVPLDVKPSPWPLSPQPGEKPHTGVLTDAEGNQTSMPRWIFGHVRIVLRQFFAKKKSLENQHVRCKQDKQKKSALDQLARMTWKRERIKLLMFNVSSKWPVLSLAGMSRQFQDENLIAFRLGKGGGSMLSRLPRRTYLRAPSRLDSVGVSCGPVPRISVRNRAQSLKEMFWSHPHVCMRSSSSSSSASATASSPPLHLGIGLLVRLGLLLFHLPAPMYAGWTAATR